MINFSLISAIIRGDWAIEQQFAINSLPLVERILNGTFTGLQQEENLQPQLISGNNSSTPGNHIAGKVMLLPVKGVLMKQDGMCGIPGMSSMANYIRDANRDPDIAGVVLMIDSPGGTVDGTEALANTIKNSSKPVVAWIDGLAASAALWIASAAREIIASNGHDEIGSVGAMLRVADMQPAMEREGVRFHTLVSDQTPDKNKLAFDVLSGDYEGYKVQYLNRVAQNFIDAVRTNRPVVLDTQLTGKMYFAEDVIGTLVDRTGSLEYSIERVLELSQTEEPISNSHISMKQFSQINAVLGVEALETVDDTVSFMEEQLVMIDNALARYNPIPQLEDDLANANAELVTAAASLNQANQDLEAANTRIQQLESMVAELETEPGAEPAQVIKQTDGDTRSNFAFPLSATDIELFNLVKR